MKVTLEEMAQPFLLRIVEEDKDVIQQSINEIWKTKKDELFLKGFRKGHVPQDVAENMVGFQSLYEEYINSCISTALAKANAENNTMVVDLQQIYPERIGRDGIVMQAIAYLKPTVEVDYSNLQVEKQNVEVSDEEIKTHINQLLEQHALQVPVLDRGVEFGDNITVSFVGTINGIPFEGGTATKQRLQLLQNSFIAGFGEQIQGQKPDEKRTIAVTFPADYRATQLAGKDAQFDVTIHEISRKDLPALDDDFAQLSGAENLADLLVKTQVEMVARKKEYAKATVETLLVTQLLSRAKISAIPQTMIERYLGQMLQQQINQLGMTEQQFFERSKSDRDKFNQTYYHIAKRDIKVQLILDTIAESENFTVSADEYDNYINTESLRLGLAPADLRAATTSDQVESRVKMRKAYDLLLDRAVYLEPAAAQG